MTGQAHDSGASGPTSGWSRFGLALSGEEFAAVRSLLGRAAEVEPALTGTLLRAVATHQPARLSGLERRVKSVDSLARKLADRPPTVSFDAALHAVSDSVRYTVIIPVEQYSARTQDLLYDLDRQGLSPGRMANTFGGNGYQGVNTQWVTRAGFRCEVQFHTPQSRIACSRTHGLYEELRLSTTTPERCAELNAQRRRLFEGVESPPGVASLRLPAVSRDRTTRGRTDADRGRNPSAGARDPRRPGTGQGMGE